jgi:hypothetical protein
MEKNQQEHQEIENNYSESNFQKFMSDAILKEYYDAKWDAIIIERDTELAEKRHEELKLKDFLKKYPEIFPEIS